VSLKKAMRWFDLGVVKEWVWIPRIPKMKPIRVHPGRCSRLVGREDE